MPNDPIDNVVDPPEPNFGIASRNGVELALHRVAQQLPDDRWLPESNRYHKNCQDVLDEDVKSETLHGSDLAEYIGISGIAHCVDGWSCIGRSIHCFLKGDPYNAVHLAYYSELRAVFSILASEGVGVFNLTHFLVDEAGIAQRLDGPDIPTHRLAWSAFDWWAKEDRAIDLFKKIIAPSGVYLARWLESFAQGEATIQQIGKEWLNRWGMDIRVLNRGDRSARNVASYWPTGVEPWEAMLASDGLKRLGEFWRPFEPKSSSRFDRLDKHFLRTLIEIDYSGITGRKARSIQGKPRFTRMVERMLEEISVADRNDLLGFLTGETEPAQLTLMDNASNDSPIGVATHIVEMISRALLLLRIATGSSESHLKTVEMGRTELGFWIETMGVERGIWSVNNEPPDFLDLWVDISEALEDILEISEDGPADELYRSEYFDRYSRSISKLEQHERVAMWGLGF